MAQDNNPEAAEKPRMPAPSTTGAEDDAKLDGSNGRSPKTAPQVSPPSVPDPGKDPDGWSRFKGMGILGWCIFGVCALALVDHIWPREDSTLLIAIEVLKTVIIAIIGYLFAQRSIRKDDD